MRSSFCDRERRAQLESHSEESTAGEIYVIISEWGSLLFEGIIKVSPILLRFFLNPQERLVVALDLTIPIMSSTGSWALNAATISSTFYHYFFSLLVHV
jgi:hypothetical protein